MSIINVYHNMQADVKFSVLIMSR